MRNWPIKIARTNKLVVKNKNAEYFLPIFESMKLFL